MVSQNQVSALRAVLKNQILLTDGAMGTYYAMHHKGKITPEMENIDNPDLIEKIHREYVNSGAKLLRTNTFAANCRTLDVDHVTLRDIVKSGYRIALNAAKDKDVFIAADIGPIPESVSESPGKSYEKSITDEYIELIDVFMEEGARIFWFETFGRTEDVENCARYIKGVCPDSFVIIQFAMDDTGYTREGISLSTVCSRMKKNPTVDAWGFNCAMGPVHMLSLIEELPTEKDFLLSALPNAGYPHIENQRTVYPGNPEYFADLVVKMVEAGAKIVGGCCGTTPVHIQAISQRLFEAKYKINPKQKETKETESLTPFVANPFKEKLDAGEKVIMVELDPPFSSDTELMLQSAEYIKRFTDVITVADSPLGKVRADSLMIAARVKRKIDVETVPHLCCRDKNIVGLKAGILGAHAEGIRNILVVTGDPLPGNERTGTKSVFNLNSKGLISLIHDMNHETFVNSKINIGAAVNPNVPNFDAVMKKTEEKVKAGASFFLSQPVYSEQAVRNLLRIKKEMGIKVIAGILPLASYNNAIFLNNEVPGIVIPEEFVQRFSKDMNREEAYRTGVDIALECVEKAKELDGYYFMPPFNRVTMIADIIKEMKK